METTGTPTGQQLAAQLNGILEPLSKVAYWEHTGGGCAAIIIGNDETSNRNDSSFLMLTAGEDIFTMADQHRPLKDEWGEDWDCFYIGHYAYDPADEDWWSEEAHSVMVDGLEHLAAAAAEWCLTGAITGWVW